MIGHEYARSSGRVAGDSLKHRKLVGGNGNIFVDAAFDVPAREVAAKGAREGAGSESTDRGALPITIVDVGFIFADAWLFQRLPERPAPRNFRDFVAQSWPGDEQHTERGTCGQQQKQMLSHRASEGAGAYSWVESNLLTATFPGVLLSGTGLPVLIEADVV